MHVYILIEQVERVALNALVPSGLGASRSTVIMPVSIVNWYNEQLS